MVFFFPSTLLGLLVLAAPSQAPRAPASTLPAAIRQALPAGYQELAAERGRQHLATAPL